MNVAHCSEFEVLISADLDGELDERERVSLQQHLVECSACREWRHACQRVNSHVATVTWLPEDGTSSLDESFVFNGAARPIGVIGPTGETHVSARRSTNTLERHKAAGRWFLAVAAVLLVAIGISFGIYSGRTAQAQTISIEPVATMHAINLQTEQDQQATLRAVAMELRVMKLEMKQLSLDPTDRRQMETRIDSLLAKTRQLDASTQISFQGEKP